jgi:hypothetical protein
VDVAPGDASTIYLSVSEGPFDPGEPCWIRYELRSVATTEGGLAIDLVGLPLAKGVNCAGSGVDAFYPVELNEPFMGTKVYDVENGLWREVFREAPPSGEVIEP